VEKLIRFRRFIEKFAADILVYLIIGILTFVVATKVTLAEHQVKIEKIESGIDLLRKENNASHQQILDVLLKDK
jgi:cell division protein FtsL